MTVITSETATHLKDLYAGLPVTFYEELRNLDIAEMSCNSMERDPDLSKQPSVHVLRQGIEIKKKKLIERLDKHVRRKTKE